MSSTEKQWVKVRGGDEPREDLDEVDGNDDSRLLIGAEASLFRSVAAKFNYFQRTDPTCRTGSRRHQGPCHRHAWPTRVC